MEGSDLRDSPAKHENLKKKDLQEINTNKLNTIANSQNLYNY